MRPGQSLEGHLEDMRLHKEACEAWAREYADLVPADSNPEAT